MTDTAVHIGQDSTIVLHDLVFRDSDDTHDEVIVGRAALGEFVELPRVGAAAVRLLGQGRTVAEAEAQVAAEHDVRPDLAELAEALVELGFVAAVDGRPMPDPAAGRPPHLPWLRDGHVRWLFGRTAGLLWVGVVLAALVTWWQRPDVFVEASDFYWTGYIGLAVLVNTLLLSASLSIHELMHLAAARSYGAPARISFATRLHHLVVQTDVTAVWAVPRRLRYRVYLAGIAWDVFLVCACGLLIAHGALPVAVDKLLAAGSLCVLLALLFQVQVYMRTDLYYVLMEWLRCRNLFQDGMAYARHLWHQLTGRPSTDPTVDLDPRERRAVRIYSVAVVTGSAVALSTFAVYGLPILVEGLVRAFSGLVTGDPMRTLDSALVIAVEGAIQVMFLITFYRRRLSRRWPIRRAGHRAGASR